MGASGTEVLTGKIVAIADLFRRSSIGLNQATVCLAQSKPLLVGVVTYHCIDSHNRLAGLAASVS